MSRPAQPSVWCRAHEPDERGVALLVVIVGTAFLAALGAVLTLASTTEVAIGVSYREATETLYAAESGVEFVMQEVAAIDDWTGLGVDAVPSAFVDGTPGGTRAVGGETIDLATVTADLNRPVSPGPGPVRPWVLHSFGRLRDLVPFAAGDNETYLAVWVAKYADGSGAPPDPNALTILGQAYGPRGGRRIVEVLVEKAGAQTIRRRAWRQPR